MIIHVSSPRVGSLWRSTTDRFGPVSAMSSTGSDGGLALKGFASRYLKNLSGQRFCSSAITDVLVNSAHSLISQIGVFLNAHKVLTSDSAGTSGMCTQQWSTTWFMVARRAKVERRLGAVEDGVWGGGVAAAASERHVPVSDDVSGVGAAWNFDLCHLEVSDVFCRGCKPNRALAEKTASAQDSSPVDR